MSLDLIAERNGILDPSLAFYLPLYKKDGNQFISDDAYGHLCTVNVGATAIDVGNAATNRSAAGAVGRTYIDLANAANYTGRITSVEIWAATDMTGARVGSFYLMGGTTYKCRDSVTIGNVTSGSKQTFTTGVNFAIKAGDFIGIYSDTGTIEMEASGGSGIVGILGEYIDEGDIVEYTAFASYAISLYATGTSSGKLWTPQGHVLDGDDYIKNSTANWRSGDSSGSILVWFKTSTASGTLFSSNDEGGTSYQFAFAINAAGKLLITQLNNDTQDIVNGDTVVTDGLWHLGSVVSSGTAWSMYSDLNLQALTVTGGANTGDWLADTPNRDNFTIGVRQRDTFLQYFVGTIGEMWYSSRALSVSTIAQKRDATKWRYT